VQVINLNRAALVADTT